MRNVKIRQACIIVLYQQRQQENQNGQSKNCLKVEDRKKDKVYTSLQQTWWVERFGDKKNLGTH